MYIISALLIGIAFSGARTPTWTWTPKICSRLASHCICSTRAVVARVGTDRLRRPVGEGVRTRAHHAEVAPGSCHLHLLEGAGQVLARLGHRRADAGDDLDGRLEQLVLGLWMLLSGHRSDLGQDLRGTAGQLARVTVDELELPLDAQTRPLGRLKRDVHVHQAMATAGPESPISRCRYRLGWHSCDGQTEPDRASPGDRASARTLRQPGAGRRSERSRGCGRRRRSSRRRTRRHR